MNRPDQRNALSMEMREAFANAVEEVRSNPEIKVVVLYGRGGHFCAGGDIKLMIEQQSEKANVFSARQKMRDMHRWFDELVDLEKPVIAAVEGGAFGAGLSLALSADYIVASPDAAFCCAFTRMGLAPDLGSMYLLPRLIGLSKAKDMVFTARVVKAAEALSLGLVNHIFQGDLLANAISFAEGFHSAPTQTIGVVKAIMNRAFESERRTVYEQEAMLRAMLPSTDFHREALRRFSSKESPQYTWSERSEFCDT